MTRLRGDVKLFRLVLSTSGVNAPPSGFAKSYWLLDIPMLLLIDFPYII